ncbi:hypothetical protein PAHAL_3G484800 [Panicum hallii]|uniref:Uncharacterized protein n=1 Tax=Panicum hallii TaxID=206008 RepID=A0A2T8KLX1_9POAL|nr:hypothetical protein PAHAL_3G484800 [Panicum hallii]
MLGRGWLSVTQFQAPCSNWRMQSRRPLSRCPSCIARSRWNSGPTRIMQCQCHAVCRGVNNLVQACIAWLLQGTINSKTMFVMVRGDGDSCARFLWALLGF